MFNTIIKKALYYGTKIIQSLISNYELKVNKDVINVVYYPSFKNESDLSDHINRSKWYITNFNNSIIYFGIDSALKAISNNSLKDHIFQRRPVTSASNVQILLCNGEEIKIKLKSAYVICIWNVNFNKSLRFMFLNLSKIRIVDPNFYLYTEAFTNASILWYDIFTKKQREKWLEESYYIFSELYSKYSNKNKVYLFGTGPSIQEAYKHDFTDGVRVICNTIIKNDEMLEHIKPNIITFTDAAFHFGVSKYSETFAKDLLKVVHQYKCYCVTNLVGYALMRTHYPELRQYLIGVPAIRFGPPVIMNINNFGTRAYKYTILTRIMMPLAAGLSHKIVLIGFDGKKIDKNDYFWKHNKTTQYMDNMRDIWETHKSFFRDTDYKSHYLGHSKVLEKVILNYEKKGIVFEVLGNTHVPILINRLKK